MTFTISKESLPFRADKSISQITLSNERLTIVVHDYGARVHQLLTPDKMEHLKIFFYPKTIPKPMQMMEDIMV